MKKLIFVVGLAMSGFLHAGQDRSLEKISNIVEAFKQHEKLSSVDQNELHHALIKLANKDSTRVLINSALLQVLVPFVQKTGKPLAKKKRHEKKSENPLFKQWLFIFVRKNDMPALEFLIDQKWVDINVTSGKGLTVLDMVESGRFRLKGAEWVDYLKGKGARPSRDIVPLKIKRREKRQAAEVKLGNPMVERAGLQVIQEEVLPQQEEQEDTLKAEEKQRKSVQWAEVVATVIGGRQEQAGLPAVVCPLERDEKEDKGDVLVRDAGYQEDEHGGDPIKADIVTPDSKFDSKPGSKPLAKPWFYV